MEPARLLSVAEVAGMLTISTREVWRRADSGELPEPLRLGARTRRWLREEIEAVIEGAKLSVGAQQAWLFIHPDHFVAGDDEDDLARIARDLARLCWQKQLTVAVPDLENDERVVSRDGGPVPKGALWAVPMPHDADAPQGDPRRAACQRIDQCCDCIAHDPFPRISRSISAGSSSQRARASLATSPQATSSSPLIKPLITVRASTRGETLGGGKGWCHSSSTGPV